MQVIVKLQKFQNVIEATNNPRSTLYTALYTAGSGISRFFLYVCLWS